MPQIDLEQIISIISTNIGIPKENISINTLRHIYVTRRDLKLEEKSGLERNKIAKIMGHSVGTQQNYLWHTYEKEKKS